MTMLSDLITYTEVDNINLFDAKRDIDTVVNILYENKFIKKRQKQFFARCNPKMPHLYSIAKVHKLDWPLRPIISQIDSPACKLNTIKIIRSQDYSV